MLQYFEKQFQTIIIFSELIFEKYLMVGLATCETYAHDKYMKY